MPATYPIRVPRSPYRGSSARGLRERQRYNDDAAAIEEYVNREVAKRGPGEHMIIYDEIVNALGLAYFRVTELLGRVGSAGNTAIVVRVLERRT